MDPKALAGSSCESGSALLSVALALGSLCVTRADLQTPRTVNPYGSGLSSPVRGLKGSPAPCLTEKGAECPPLRPFWAGPRQWLSWQHELWVSARPAGWGVGHPPSCDLHHREANPWAPVPFCLVSGGGGLWEPPVLPFNPEAATLAEVPGGTAESAGSARGAPPGLHPVS